MPSSSPTRRQWLQAVGLTGFGGFGGLAGLSGLAPLAAWAAPAAAQPGPAGPQRLAAAWMQGHDLFAGIVQLTLDGAPLQVLQSERIPTRAHGMTVEADGAVVFTSRRPGDWLLRLRAGTAPQWGWIEPDRAFTGHVIHSRDGRQLYTTETDLETGQGLIGVRDAASLEKPPNGPPTAWTRTSCCWMPTAAWSSPTAAFPARSRPGGASCSSRRWTPPSCACSLPPRARWTASGA
jgi:hypothetical protein